MELIRHKTHTFLPTVEKHVLFIYTMHDDAINVLI